MALVKDNAVVLRRLDYSETSQVLAMFTRRNGQLRLIARGIKRSTKKRVAVGIDLLEAGRLVFSHRSGKEDNLATLTEWHQEDNFAHLRRELARWHAAQYAAEVTSHLTEVHDPHPDLFDGLYRFLGDLKKEDTLATLSGYLWLMLTEIGLRPELTRCVNCQRQLGDEDLLYFSARQGGAICRDCEPAIVDKRRISMTLARSLASGTHNDRLRDARPAFDLLDYYLTEILSRPPRLSHSLRESLSARFSKKT